MPWLRTEDALVADDLQEVHRELRALARHLEEQADRAPYSFVAERLRELAEAEERNAALVAERLAAHGRAAEADGAGVGVDGRNAWERLVGANERYRRLIRRLKQLSVRWEDEHPEDAAALARALERSLRSQAVVADLIARADPHALD